MFYRGKVTRSIDAGILGMSFDAFILKRSEPKLNDRATSVSG